MMLRRGYNYTDGADALGKLDAGLFFIAFVRDPRAQYVPIQEEDVAKRPHDHGVPEDGRVGALRGAAWHCLRARPWATSGAFVGQPLFA